VILPPRVRTLEGSRPQAGPPRTGTCLLALVGTVPDGESLFDEPGADVHVAGPAEGERTAIAVAARQPALDGTAGDLSDQGLLRRFSAAVGSPSPLAGLLHFGGVHPLEADGEAGEPERIAVDHLRKAGRTALGRLENEQGAEGEAQGNDERAESPAPPRPCEYPPKQ
jgi:hypothetical protein